LLEKISKPSSAIFNRANPPECSDWIRIFTSRVVDSTALFIKFTSTCSISVEFSATANGLLWSWSTSCVRCVPKYLKGALAKNGIEFATVQPANDDCENICEPMQSAYPSKQSANTGKQPAPIKAKPIQDKGRQDPPIPPTGGSSSITVSASGGVLAEIPKEIDSPEFREAWSEWVADRKERKKPITQRAAKQQLKSLIPLGPVKAAECLLASIQNGWAGLFPEKFVGQAAKQPPKSFAEVRVEKAVTLLDQAKQQAIEREARQALAGQPQPAITAREGNDHAA
jgi:hypothetical protein